MQIRMGIVDGHTLVREGLRAIIQLDGNMELSFECDNFDLAKSYLDGSPDINILLIDISVPGHDGFEVIEMANLKGIKSIVVNLHNGSPHIMEARRANAHGYMSLGASAEEMLDGIRTVHNNGTFYSKPLEKYLSHTVENNPFLDLTSREMHICRLLLDGVKVKKIASLLDISPKTVYVHKANAYRKLTINSTQTLFKLAKENGVHGIYKPE